MDRPNQELADRRRVFWIGPTTGEEFGPCYDRLVENNSVLVKESPSAGLAAIEETNGFDLTVLACPRLLVTTDPLEALRDALAPQPLVQLLGTWCEGEGRTGEIVEGVTRVFWHAWPVWLNCWTNSGWTNSDSEQPIEGLVEIMSRDPEFARSLIETFASTTPAIWSPSLSRSVSTPPAAILWDGSQLGGREADQLYEVCQNASKTETPVIAMLDFPRPEIVAAAQDIGAVAVLGKPFSVELLNETLLASLKTRGPAELGPSVEIETEQESEASQEPMSLREQLQAERKQLAGEAA